jgi:Tol biopolymer transport system component
MSFTQTLSKASAEVARSTKTVVLALVLTVVLGIGAAAPTKSMAAQVPSIGSEWVSEVVFATAIVHAKISPNGAATSYRVEYGPTAAYGASAPVPDGSLGGNLGETEVMVGLGGLQAGTTYHYRIVANNSEGTTQTLDKAFATFSKPVQQSDTCPNATYRSGVSENLPDCRAYELVTPVDKNGAEVTTNYGAFRASVAGDGIFFASSTGIGEMMGTGVYGFSEYVTSRGSAGWTTKGITPTPALNVPQQGFSFNFTRFLDASETLQRAVFFGYDLPGVEGARTDSKNLYVEDTASGKLLEAVTNGMHEGEPINVSYGEETPELGGSSGDMSVVTFEMLPNLLPEASGVAPKVYALEHGVLKLVGVLRDGSVPAGGSVLARDLGVGFAASWPAIGFKDTVSRDGSRIFFLSPASGERQLYMRENGSKTVLISESEETGEQIAAQNVGFQGATPDGKHVLFTTSTRLLDSAPEGGGLYLYTDGPDPAHEANLTYLARGVGVEGFSEDASRIYYVENESLFLWNQGQRTRIVSNFGAWNQEVRVTPDGSKIAFISSGHYTHADRTPGIGNAYEMYLYDVGTGKLTCVSCPPSGSAITTGIDLQVGEILNFEYATGFRPRFISDDGRFVFFNTSESLLPQDTDGVVDAYEYDTQTGTLSLLSLGVGGGGTWFAEAGADGHDVFLVTHQQLSAWDPDNLVDLYDARVDGGLSDPPARPVPCLGDACQGLPSAAPSFNAASEFSGVPNPQAGGTAKPTARARSLSRAQRYKRAVGRCRARRRGRERRLCEASARKRFGSKSKRAIRAGR